MLLWKLPKNIVKNEFVFYVIISCKMERIEFNTNGTKLIVSHEVRKKSVTNIKFEYGVVTLDFLIDDGCFAQEFIEGYYYDEGSNLSITREETYYEIGINVDHPKKLGYISFKIPHDITMMKTGP
jgi:hypothetical protein